MEARESWVRVVVAGLAIGAALYLLDPLYFALLLVGPLVTGAVIAAYRGSARWAVATWVVAGLAVLAYDQVVNGEDAAFHVVVTVVTALLARGAHALTTWLRRRRAARPLASA